MIDATQAIALLEQVVDENGRDFVYQKSDIGFCEYVRDGKPSCLVGKALFKAGVSIEDLSKLDQYDNGGGVQAAMLDKVFPHLASSEAMGVFSAAQSCQDGGQNWGTALDRAKEVKVD